MTTRILTAAGLALVFAAGGEITSASAIVVLPDATVHLQTSSYPDVCGVGGIVCQPNVTYDGSLISINPPCSGPQGDQCNISESYVAGIGIHGSYPAGSVTATAYGTLPQVLVQATANSAGVAELFYDFEILGPVNTIVPLIFTGTFTNGGNEGDNNTFLEVTEPSISTGQIFGVSPFSVLGTAGYTTPVIPFAVTSSGFTSDVVYQVELFAQTFSCNTCTAGYADVDPMISISSTFAGANQFQLLFSPGIGNSPASTSVPEPATLALFGVGLAGILAMRRRRKST